MIILLYGKDDFRKREKLNEIIEKYKQKHKSGVNVKFIESPNNFSEVFDEDRQTSIFSEKKLIIVRDSFSSPEMKESISLKLDDVKSSENIIVLYEEKDIRKNDALIGKLVKKGVMVQEFNTLSRSGIVSFIKKEFNKREVEIDEKALCCFVDFVGDNLWRIKGEVEKLSSYSKKLTEEDILLLVRPETETNIFKTVDALAEGKRDVAASLIYEHLQKGDHALYLLSMIEYQFRNLMIIRDMIDRGISSDFFAKEAGMHPFVAKKSGVQAKSFSRERLDKDYGRLFEMDLKVKTGQIDPVTAIHILLSEL